MRPLVGDRPDGRVGSGVGTLAFDALRFGRVKVRIARPQRRILDFVVEDHGERVGLDDAERAAGREEAGDHPRPALQVRQPPQDPVGREHDIELTAEPGGEVVEVAVDEGGRDAHLPGQSPRRPDRLFGEIDAGHSGAPAGPRQRVEPKMTLQVQQRLSGYIAEEGGFESIEPGAPAPLAGLEPLEIVEPGPEMVSGPHVPRLLIDLEIVSSIRVHRR